MADDPAVEIDPRDLVYELQRDPHASVAVERDAMLAETQRQCEDARPALRGNPNESRLVLLR